MIKLDLTGTIELIVENVGPKLVVGMPLGLGKSNPFANALYARAKDDPTLDLEIVTALSLALPSGSSLLERRFLAPFVARHFGSDYPQLDFVRDMNARALPDNVRVTEFYFQSGSKLGNPCAQRHYIASNYTHVARDLIDRGVNVVAQIVAADRQSDDHRLSLSCNPDVTLDIARRLRQRPHHQCLMIGQIHEDLPYLHGDALVDPEFFDVMIEESLSHELFAVPKAAVSRTDHAIGLHASSLIRDAGTLQIGIGSLSDALVNGLQLRHQAAAVYRRLIQELSGGEIPRLAAEIGGIDPFQKGLFGASEMFMDGFMHLYRAGILKRPAFENTTLQRLSDAGDLPTRPTHALLVAMVEQGDIAQQLTPADLNHLQELGLVDRAVRLDDADGSLVNAQGWRLSNDVFDDSWQDRGADFLASAIPSGALVDAAFYLGSKEFYQWLNALSREERPQFRMVPVSRVNQIYGGNESLEIAQRRDARFVNTCMKMTLTGSGVSDGLENYQVVSGVGGQYNFVAMAHALDEGRSILMLRSVRGSGKQLESNIVWEHPYITIPRHLRDIVITEYGIADLRGKTDEQCIIEMIAIADSRFQQKLADSAISAGKLRPDFTLSGEFANNTPERLAAILEPFEQSGHLGLFPFGSDFTEIELRLIKGLGLLKSARAKPLQLAGALMRGSPGDFPQEMSRMGLADPQSLKERAYARILSAMLTR